MKKLFKTAALLGCTVSGLALSAGWASAGMVSTGEASTAIMAPAPIVAFIKLFMIRPCPVAAVAPPG